MKSNKRLKLILIFGLVLLMLFATVACDRDDKAPNATDETRARRTKATETLETEPFGESSEETTTVDPEATEPESTEPESTEDDGASITTEKYDPSKDPENIVTTEPCQRAFRKPCLPSLRALRLSRSRARAVRPILSVCFIRAAIAMIWQCWGQLLPRAVDLPTALPS